MRMTAQSASWQFADGENIMLEGVPILVPGTKDNIIQHLASEITGDGTGNIALCQLFCIQHNCDFIAYGSHVCMLMRRPVGALKVNPRTITGGRVTSVMVNMHRYVIDPVSLF